MTSWQSAMQGKIREAEAAPAPRLPVTMAEAFMGSFRHGQLDDPVGQRDIMLSAYQELHDRFRDISGEDPAERAKREGIDFEGLGRDGRAAVIGRFVDTLPDAQQKLLDDYKDVRGRAQKKAAEIEKEAAEVEDATYGSMAHIASFTGGVARAALNPVNAAMMLLGAARPVAGAGAGAVTRWLGKEFIIGAATQAVQEPVLARQRAELGLEGNSFENILEAGTAQAGFSAVLRAGGAALRALRRAGKTPEIAANIGPEDLEAVARHVEADAAMDRMVGDPVRGHETLARARAALEEGTPLETVGATRGTGIDLSRPRGMSLPDGSKIDVQYGLADLSEIRASHGLDGTPNPDYPQALQPRDREAAASQRWVDETAARLDPERLGVAPGPQEGAPVLAPDGIVESGNGRVLAIARAYERFPEKAAEYRAYLEELGFETGTMERPVLVRVRQNEFTPEQRIAFTRESNVASTASLAASERAKVDAGKLDEGVLSLWQGGAASDVKNAPFVQRFKALAVDRAEAAGFDPDGRLTRPGADRIRAALVARAWREPDLVKKVAEDLGETSKAIVDAMVETAPEAARLRAAIEEGRLAPEYDVVTPMIRAFQTIENARRTGKKLSALADQADIERGMMSDAERAGLRLFFLDDEMTIAASAEVTAGRIRAAIGDALLKQGGDLFAERIEAPGLLRAARYADEPIGDHPLSSLERAKQRSEAAKEVAPKEGEAAPAALPKGMAEVEARLAGMLGSIDPEKEVFDFGRFDREGQPAKSSARAEFEAVKAEARAAAELQDCVVRTVGAASP